MWVTLSSSVEPRERYNTVACSSWLLMSKLRYWLSPDSGLSSGRGSVQDHTWRERQGHFIALLIEGMIRHTPFAEGTADHSGQHCFFYGKKTPSRSVRTWDASVSRTSVFMCFTYFRYWRYIVLSFHLFSSLIIFINVHNYLSGFICRTLETLVHKLTYRFVRYFKW